MFKEAGRPASEVDAMSPAFAEWLLPRLRDGQYFGFIAEDSDQTPIAGIGLMRIEWPPHPLHANDSYRGYVLNVFVEPAFRERGIAKLLLEKSEQEFRERKISYAILHATEAGR